MSDVRYDVFVSAEFFTIINSAVYIYIYICMCVCVFGLVWFYGISSLVGY